MLLEEGVCYDHYQSSSIAPSDWASLRLVPPPLGLDQAIWRMRRSYVGFLVDWGLTAPHQAVLRPGWWVLGREGPCQV